MTSKDHNHGDGSNHCCSIQSAVPSVSQTMDEMDWERGIWPAALEGDTARLERLLRSGVPADRPDRSGYTALHYAARAGQLAAVDLLLAAGAAPDTPTGGGATALQRAAGAGRLAVIRRLTAAGASLTARDQRGQTALHRAAEAQKTDACRLLLQMEPALADVRDDRGRRPADLVTGDGELRQLLIVEPEVSPNSSAEPG
ncbi:ankyrin repeat domain-containing protein 39-like [Amphibalanus amphitrite]|uniref:ankyrin repeat domain-containing protein 39-like n=1 Tax=Amphibalanus amphitrite TaxID=1232801 RepID=UPI001C90F273|nr:ankyrin repeat domain-containing protein 39-like [Amphibalanus amphitrite]XP_043215691.1 ankyrin repeat domain-containing protein 39-like [Amphibalanus amphitrite]